jgi:plasmid stabilization system protein ParE
MLDAASWYLEEASSLQASRFLVEVHRSLGLLVRLPGLGTPGGHGVHQLPLRRFPYTLVYRQELGLIRVIAVAHQRRDPNYWANRR